MLQSNIVLIFPFFVDPPPLNLTNKMDMQKMEAAFRNSSLIANYLFNTLTEDEQLQLDEWIENNKLLFHELTSTVQQLDHYSHKDITKRRAHKRLMRKLFSRTNRFNNCKPLRSAQRYFLRCTSASNSSCA